MKLNSKKSFWAGMLAFFVGTSCCWLSSLAIWLGGATLITSLVSFIEDIRILLFVIGGLFCIMAVFLFYRSRNKRHEKTT